jgi:hypothetical protein
MRIRILDQVVEVDAVVNQQFADQRADEKAIGAGPDSDPLIGDRGIAGAHRIDRDDLRAAALELAEAELDRIGVVILGDAEHQQVFRLVPIRLAEFPKRSAQRVHAGGSHVDRAEAAVRGIVDRAELLRPPAGQRLRLVAAGEEGELVRIGLADGAEPLRRERQRLVPFDFAELAGPAFADSQQRLGQARGRIVLHDPGRALRAQHALVDRVRGVSLDVAHAAVFQVHFDATPARAHIARGRLDLVADRFVEFEVCVGHRRAW